MTQTLLKANVVRPKGTTRHYEGRFDTNGEPVKGVELESPVAVEIASDDSGFYVFRLDGNGACISDTWHMTLDEAKAQVGFEFELSAEGWIASKA